MNEIYMSPILGRIPYHISYLFLLVNESMNLTYELFFEMSQFSLYKMSVYGAVISVISTVINLSDFKYDRRRIPSVNYTNARLSSILIYPSGGLNIYDEMDTQGGITPIVCAKRLINKTFDI